MALLLAAFYLGLVYEENNALFRFLTLLYLRGKIGQLQLDNDVLKKLQAEILQRQKRYAGFGAKLRPVEVSERPVK